MCLNTDLFTLSDLASFQFLPVVKLLLSFSFVSVNLLQYTFKLV